MIEEIEAKSILRLPKKIDSWFLSTGHLNLYRGCLHDCLYCDGRAEKYNVAGDFGTNIAVKINAPGILAQELDPTRRRKPRRKGFICLGGGVGDAYQPVETTYGLARQTLEILERFGAPVHVLTKSLLIEHELDLLAAINRRSRVIVSMSFSSVDEKTSALLEPGVAAPHKRLAVLARARQRNLACGMFLMPVAPFMTDSQAMIEDTVRAAKSHGVNFIIFGGMTLKPGRQRDYFLRKLSEARPNEAKRIATLFERVDEYGSAPAAYYNLIAERFRRACHNCGMPTRIPLPLWMDVVSADDRVIVLLEHIDYLLKLSSKRSGYGYAAFQLSKVKEPLGDYLANNKNQPNMSVDVRRTALEILETGTARRYEELTADWVLPETFP